MVYPELLGVTDDAGSIDRWLVRSVDAVQVVGSGVFQAVAQMPDRGKSFRGPEHLLTGALAGNFFIAPMHLDRLLIFSFDGRDPHPNIGLSSLCIPTFDLVGEWLALGGKADVLASVLWLGEIEILLVEPNQQREVFLDRRGQQVRAGGVRDKVNRARVFPIVILGRSLRKEPGKNQDKGQSRYVKRRIHFHYSSRLSGLDPRFVDLFPMRAMRTSTLSPTR